MDLLMRIMAATPAVDATFENCQRLPSRLRFDVPRFHRRAAELEKYEVSFRRVAARDIADGFVIVDEKVPFAVKARSAFVTRINADERTTKTVDFVDAVASQVRRSGARTVIAIGGGVTLNAGSAVAAAVSTRLVLVPTSVLAMADASTGGKVRLNARGNGFLRKHGIRSDYDPDAVILDWSFLTSLPADEFAWGWSEAVKHGIFQSPNLLQFLCDNFAWLRSDSPATRRAIIWTMALKRLCLQIDPLESEAGSRVILGACHDEAHALEENSGFKLSHGQAVFAAVLKFLRDTRSPLRATVEALLDKLGVWREIEQIVPSSRKRLAA